MSESPPSNGLQQLHPHAPIQRHSGKQQTRQLPPHAINGATIHQLDTNKGESITTATLIHDSNSTSPTNGHSNSHHSHTIPILSHSTSLSKLGPHSLLTQLRLKLTSRTQRQWLFLTVITLVISLTVLTLHNSISKPTDTNVVIPQLEHHLSYFSSFPSYSPMTLPSNEATVTGVAALRGKFLASRSKPKPTPVTVSTTSVTTSTTITPATTSTTITTTTDSSVVQPQQPQQPTSPNQPASIILKAAMSQFELASALSLRLPVVASKIIAAADLASTLNIDAFVSQQVEPPSILSQALDHLFTRSTCEVNDRSRYLIYSCTPNKVADIEHKHLSHVLEMLRALTLAVSSSRTLIIDSSTCSTKDAGESGNACCLMSQYFKPLSKCELDWSTLTDDEARASASQGMEIGLHGASSALVNPYNEVPFSFFHSSLACHPSRSIWSTIPGLANGRPMSRIQIIRILTSFLTQPTDTYRSTLESVRGAFLEQLRVQAVLAGFDGEPYQSQLGANELPQFLSAYIPLNIADTKTTITQLQTSKHIPSRTWADATSRINTGKTTGVRATNETPLPSPFAAKTLSRYYSMEEYLDAIRADTTNYGFNIVLVWSHDHRKSDTMVSAWESESLVVQELRRRLPHLIILDAHAIGLQASAMTSTQAATVASFQFQIDMTVSFNSLFLMSSASYSIGSFARHPYRLMTFLLPDASSSYSHVPALPYRDLDASGWYLACWDSAFHIFQRETLPTRTKVPLMNSPLGRLMYPPMKEYVAAPSKGGDQSQLGPYRPQAIHTISLNGRSVAVPVQKQFDSIRLPRVKLLIVYGARHSGMEPLGAFFDHMNLPRHKKLSQMLFDLHVPPMSIADYHSRKSAFLATLSEEVSKRMNHPRDGQPRTETDRSLSDIYLTPAELLELKTIQDREAKVAAFQHQPYTPKELTATTTPFVSSFPPETRLDADEYPAEIIRLHVDAEYLDRKDRSMMHLDLTLIQRILSDFAGSQTGVNVELQYVITTRNIRAMLQSSGRRVPFPTPAFIKPEWRFLWELRIQRDQISAMDGELRTLHPGQTCVIDWDETFERPAEIGHKLQSFLGVIGRSSKPGPDAALVPQIPSGNSVNVDPSVKLPLKNTEKPKEIPYLSWSTEFMKQPIAESNTLSHIFSDWFHNLGGRVLYENLDNHSAEGLTWQDTSMLDDLCPTWNGVSQPHLEHTGKMRTKKDKNELLVEFERKATQFVAHQAQLLEREPTNPTNRAAYLLSLARQLPNSNHASGQLIQSALTQSQFPSQSSDSGIQSCQDPNLQFLIFDGFFNLSSMPKVYSDEIRSPENMRQLPILDQCSLSGAYEFSAQVSALTRTLSLALLTGRMLIVPNIPNSITQLLDLTKISQCSLTDIGYQLSTYTNAHSSIAGQPSLEHRIGQYFIEPIPKDLNSDEPQQQLPTHLTTDPFDASKRFVQLTPDQHSLHWLLYHSTEHQRRRDDEGVKSFAPKSTGVQDFLAQLTQFVVQPSAKLLEYKGLTETALGVDPSRTRIGVVMPLDTYSASFHSTHRLAVSIVRKLDLWGFGLSRHPDAPVNEIDILVSHSCSRNNILGSGNTGRGAGNGVTVGDAREREFEQYREAFEVDAAWKKPSITPPPMRSVVRPAYERHQELIDDLRDTFEIRHETDDDDKPVPNPSKLFIHSARRTAVDYAIAEPHQFASRHELLLADIFVDVLMQVESKFTMSSYVHEEGLVIAQLRHARTVANEPIGETNSKTLIRSSWGFQLQTTPVSHFYDMQRSSYDYLSAFTLNEESQWRLAMFKSIYEVEYKVVKESTPPASTSLPPPVPSTTSPLYLAIASSWDSPGDAFAMLPPQLLSLPPPPPFTITKRIWSPTVRFVFVAGIEGVGHHFFDNILGLTRDFNTTGPLTTRRQGMSAGASLEQKNKSPQSLISMRHSGRIGIPQLRTDNHLSSFTYATFVHASQEAFDRAKRQLAIRIQWLKNAQETYMRAHPDDAPAVFVLNMLNSGGDAMQSYPNFDGLDRNMRHPDLMLMAKLFEANKADLRIISFVRSPGASYASTIARGYGAGIPEYDNTDRNNLFQARVLHDNLHFVEGDSRSIDPRFMTRIELDHMAKFPHTNAKLIADAIGLKEDTMLRSILKVTNDFHVKPSSSWMLKFNPLQVAITRDHFGHAASLGVSDGLEYYDGVMNWEASVSHSYVRAWREARAPKPKADNSKAVAITTTTKSSTTEFNEIVTLPPPPPPPSSDQRDSDVVNRVCVSITELHPMFNRAERETWPVRVALKSIQGSGDMFLRWLLEQATGVWSGSVDPYSMTKWPASTFIPSTLVPLIGPWGASGQTSVQADPTCLTCEYETSWNTADAHYKPAVTITKITSVAQYYDEDVLNAERAQKDYDDKLNQQKTNSNVKLPPTPPKHPREYGRHRTPPYEAPVEGRIVLLRHPLQIAYHLVRHWAEIHPLFQNEHRLSANEDSAEEFTRMCVEFARERLMKEALAIVAEAYPKFLINEGLVPPNFANRSAALSPDDPPERFSPTKWMEQQKGKALFVYYEELEAQPTQTLDHVLYFLGLDKHPKHYPCVQSTLEHLMEAQPSPTQTGTGPNVTPLVAFAYDQLPTSRLFTAQLPLDLTILLPREEYEAFEAKLKPYLTYFYYDVDMELMTFAAGPRWEDEKQYARARHIQPEDATAATNRFKARHANMADAMETIRAKMDRRPITNYEKISSLPELLLNQKEETS